MNRFFRDNTEVRLQLDPNTMDTDCDDRTAATKDQSLYPKFTFDTQVLINNVEKSTNVQSPTFNIKPCQSSPTMEYLGWEDFSPELIKKKYHVEFLGYVGFFCHGFGFS